MSEQEKELEEYKQQLQTVEEGLKDDPENQSLLDLKTELIDLIGLLEQALGLEPAVEDAVHERTTGISSSEESPGVLVTGTSSQDHPDLKYQTTDYYKGTPDETDRTPVPTPTPPQQPSSALPNRPPPPPSRPKFAVGNVVLAKYVSGDRKFARAKITAITGSMENPIYTVKFLRQNENITETVRSDSIREINPGAGSGFGGGNAYGSQSTSRSTSVSPSPSQPPATTHIPSKLTSHNDSSPLNPQKRPRDSSALGLPNAKSAKPSNHTVSKAKLLDDQKNKWQQFSKKITKGTKSKKVGSQSMFRTSDDPNARVGVIKGVTNSKPSKPNKHIFDSSTRIN